MKPYYADETVTLYHGDCLDVLSTLPAASVDCVVTSPPYFGAGTTGMVATQLGHRYVGIELSADNLALSLRTRLAQGDLPVGGAS